MFALYVAVTLITVAANVGIGVADLARAKFVLANAAEVDVPQSWIPGLASLKIAGALGLLLGLLGIRFIGVAAATGLVLFFIGAVIAHARARVFYNIAFPGSFLLLAVASLGLAISH